MRTPKILVEIHLKYVKYPFNCTSFSQTYDLKSRSWDINQVDKTGHVQWCGLIMLCQLFKSIYFPLLRLINLGRPVLLHLFCDCHFTSKFVFSVTRSWTPITGKKNNLKNTNRWHHILVFHWCPASRCLSWPKNMHWFCVIFLDVVHELMSTSTMYVLLAVAFRIRIKWYCTCNTNNIIWWE